MPATLCFDFGNSRLKCAVFRDAEFIESFPMDDDNDKTIKKILKAFRPDKALLSSVIDHNPRIEKILSGYCKFHKLDHNSKIPITTPVAKPETIGADRLAMVVAANAEFPFSNNLVIGVGTAITYNFVNKHAEFIGGGISPGLDMRLKSLQTFTAKLPLVEKSWNFPLMGYDTRTNILSGVVNGMIKELDGMIELYHEKYLNLNVLLTGGDSAYFARHLKSKIFADFNLIFKGLYAISELNID